MSTTERLRDRYAYLWDSLFSHPFVRGIGDGTLPLEKFQFYVRQDYIFLVQYSRVLALAAAKAPDLASIERLADLLQETLKAEMSLHRAFSQGFGVSVEELEGTRPAPITLAYSDYLLRVAYEGTVTDIIATLLPCQWGYYETGLHLARAGDTSEGNPYAEWIRMYSSEEFGSFVAWLREVLDRLTQDADARVIADLEEHFLTATRYEYLFWEMSYHMQDWPV
ncbi:MAG: thiaminase II [Chloroflexi bacterium]|nr:thiaminase II [Chloroflexota bacterium]